MNRRKFLLGVSVSAVALLAPVVVARATGKIIYDKTAKYGFNIKGYGATGHGNYKGYTLVMNPDCVEVVGEFYEENGTWYITGWTIDHHGRPYDLTGHHVTYSYVPEGGRKNYLNEGLFLPN